MDTTVDHNPNKGLEAHSKSLSNIKRGLQIAGLHGDREGARLALSVLSRLATRLEALRSPAPNLRSTIDALASVCILKVRDADHAKLQERRQKVSFSGAANFGEWLIEQLAHE